MYIDSNGEEVFTSRELAVNINDPNDANWIKLQDELAGALRDSVREMVRQIELMVINDSNSSNTQRHDT